MNFGLILLTGALALLSWLTSLASTEMNIALTTIARGVHISSSDSGWLITSYLIAFGSSTLIGGRYGDMYGYKKIIFVGIGLFTLGSLVGYFADSISVLVISRVAQGMGAALIWPACIAVVNRIATDRHKGLLIGVMTAAVGLGQVFGPLVSAWLINYSWRFIFIFNIPLLAFVTVIIYGFMPKFKLEVKHSISYVYFVSFVILISALITWLHAYNLLNTSKLGYAMLGVSIVTGFVIFLKLQAKSHRALLATELFKIKQFPFSLFTRMCGVIGFYGYLYFSVIYLSGHFGLSSAHISYVLLSMTLVMALTSFVSGTLIDKFGVNLSNYMGYTALVLGYFMNYLFSNSIIGIMFGGVFIGAGMGFTNAGAIRLGLQYMPEKLSATASSTFFMVSLICGAISVSIIGMFNKTFPYALNVIFSTEMIASAAIALIWIIAFTLYRHRQQRRAQNKITQYAV